MNTPSTILLALLGLLPLAPAAVAHEDHGSKSEEEHAGHDHEHSGNEKEEHDHETAKGPHGGQIFTVGETRFELFVAKDRKLRLAFLDAKNQLLPLAGRTVTAVGGDRAKPTRLTFGKGKEEKEQELLISDQPLPEGDHIALVLRFQLAPDAKPVTQRVTLHLHDH